MRIGEQFKNGRYTVLHKLGWGHFSTVWMVRDEQVCTASTGEDCHPPVIAFNSCSAAHLSTLRAACMVKLERVLQEVRCMLYVVLQSSQLCSQRPQPTHPSPVPLAPTDGGPEGHESGQVGGALH